MNISDTTDIPLQVSDEPAVHHGPWWLASITALGIVFGDIGTSPLYALKIALAASAHPLQPTRYDVLGVVSLIAWALTIVVALKYVVLVLRADNEGEGGILALLSLVSANYKHAMRKLPFLLLLGICGAGLLYGDGVITPAVSVLSAMEGLKVATPAFDPWVLPMTLGILIGLFLIQRRGTAEIGRWFGPIMLLWFFAIGALGVYGIVQDPVVLEALDPHRGVAFLIDNPTVAFGVFGAVFLALTGGEALYADMGHVGAPSIRRAWFWLVFPALLLSYFGQGGLLLAHPDAIDNPFYKLAPPALLLPMIALAACATVIASQALISGVFSLTRQAIQMRLSPRMAVLPTSSRAYGQIYVSLVNWGLMTATLAVVIAFKTSDNLAAAYGIAVSGTMLITTILLYRVMRDKWHWPMTLSVPVTCLFAMIDGTFLVANGLKVTEGGWLPLAIGGFVAFTMIAWRIGNIEVQQRLAENSMPFEDFIAQIDRMLVARLPGTGVFVTRMADTASPMLLHHVETNRVLHEDVILLTVVPTKRPRVPASERLEVQEIGHGFHRIVVKIGFMQRPDIPAALRACTRLGLDFCTDNLHYYIAHESLVRRPKDSALWGPVWFAFNIMHRMGLRASDYFHLPPKSVMEVGFRLEI
ncbi:MAG TPA: KUP/HAK/KT family potassium transporter [Aliidongia sp.]|nr:KUP/HAK/KT family potassium transporter [Aliidongia sp.]